MSQLYELLESSFKSDFLTLEVMRDCIDFRPLRLRPIRGSDYCYNYLGRQNFCRLPYSYQSFEDGSFDFSGFKHELSRRFVELLAPLTLYHFRQASRVLYYRCLDLRGIEYSSVIAVTNPWTREYNPMELSGYSGMLTGPVLLGRLVHFQVCFNQLRIDYHDEHFAQFLFAKTYTKLLLRLPPFKVQGDMNRFYRTVFHPGVAHGTIVCARRFSQEVHRPFSNMLGQLLPYCNNLRTMEFYASSDSESGQFLIENDPNLSNFKEFFEKWARQTSNLEVCILFIRHFYFQLVDKKLHRCVVKNGKWFWTQNYHLFDGTFRLYDPVFKSSYLPYHLHQASYSDIIRSRHFVRVSQQSCYKLAARGQRVRGPVWRHFAFEFCRLRRFCQKVETNLWWFFCVPH